jgi:hypothetical protein
MLISLSLNYILSLFNVAFFFFSFPCPLFISLLLLLLLIFLFLNLFYIVFTPLFSMAIGDTVIIVVFPYLVCSGGGVTVVCFLLSEQYWGLNPQEKAGCSLRIPSHESGRDIHPSQLMY